MLGDLEALASLDAVEVLAEVLPELPNAHLSVFHVAHGSTNEWKGSGSDATRDERDPDQVGPESRERRLGAPDALFQRLDLSFQLAHESLEIA
jgi:hypothetical protein